MAPKIVKSDDPFAAFELIDTPVTAQRRNLRPDPVQQNRLTFLEGLAVQRKLWANLSFTIKRRIYKEEDNTRLSVMVDKQPRSWWTRQGDLVEVTPRYGNRPLEISKDKFAAKMQADKVPEFFDTLGRLVNEGHYDKQFDALSRRRKSE